MESGSLAMMRSNNDRLPPLVDAVPEIRHHYRGSDHQSHYSQSRYEPSRGIRQFPEARALAPSSRGSGRGRSSFVAPASSPSVNYEQLVNYNQLGAGDETPANEFPKLRGSPSSRSSSLTLTPVARGSPSLPLLPGPRHSGNAAPSQWSPQEQRALPPIYTNGSSAGAHTGTQGPSTLQGHHETIPTYPHVASSSPRKTHYSSYNAPLPHDSSYPRTHPVGRPTFSNGIENGSFSVSIEANGDYGDGKQKRRRGNLPKAVTDILRVWFTQHIAHPYPTEEEKQVLMSRTGLTINQISNWFINARRRSLPQMTKQAQTEAGLRHNQNEKPPYTEDQG